MRVETFGDGTPEVAVVGGIHGDEPCGVDAVEYLLSMDLDVERPVKLIVANERAIELGERYVEEDLNRSFPPTLDDPGFEYDDHHEGHLAKRLVEELRDCELILGLHSTQSHPEPFAIVGEPTEFEKDVVVRLPVDAVVETGRFTQGRAIAPLPVIEVESGFQGSEGAAANARAVAEAFLRATGVLPDPLPERELPYYRLVESIPKTEAVDYEVFAENFRRVGEGEPYAASDGREHLADAPFFPVLLSAYGYESLFGYAAHRIGSLP